MSDLSLFDAPHVEVSSASKELASQLDRIETFDAANGKKVYDINDDNSAPIHTYVLPKGLPINPPANNGSERDIFSSVNSVISTSEHPINALNRIKGSVVSGAGTHDPVDLDLELGQEISVNLDPFLDSLRSILLPDKHYMVVYMSSRNFSNWEFYEDHLNIISDMNYVDVVSSIDFLWHDASSLQRYDSVIFLGVNSRILDRMEKLSEENVDHIVVIPSVDNISSTVRKSDFLDDEETFEMIRTKTPGNYFDFISLSADLICVRNSCDFSNFTLTNVNHHWDSGERRLSSEYFNIFYYQKPSLAHTDSTQYLLTDKSINSPSHGPPITTKPPENNYKKITLIDTPKDFLYRHGSNMTTVLNHGMRYGYLTFSYDVAKFEYHDAFGYHCASFPIDFPEILVYFKGKNSNIRNLEVKFFAADIGIGRHFTIPSFLLIAPFVNKKFNVKTWNLFHSLAPFLSNLEKQIFSGDREPLPFNLKNQRWFPIGKMSHYMKNAVEKQVVLIKTTILNQFAVLMSHVHRYTFLTEECEFFQKKNKYTGQSIFKRNSVKVRFKYQDILFETYEEMYTNLHDSFEADAAYKVRIENDPYNRGKILVYEYAASEMAYIYNFFEKKEFVGFYFPLHCSYESFVKTNGDTFRPSLVFQNQFTNFNNRGNDPVPLYLTLNNYEDLKNYNYFRVCEEKFGMNVKASEFYFWHEMKRHYNYQFNNATTFQTNTNFWINEEIKKIKKNNYSENLNLQRVVVKDRNRRVFKLFPNEYLNLTRFFNEINIRGSGFFLNMVTSIQKLCQVESSTLLYLDSPNTISPAKISIIIDFNTVEDKEHFCNFGKSILLEYDEKEDVRSTAEKEIDKKSLRKRRGRKRGPEYTINKNNQYRIPKEYNSEIREVKDGLRNAVQQTVQRKRDQNEEQQKMNDNGKRIYKRQRQRINRARKQQKKEKEDELVQIAIMSSLETHENVSGDDTDLQ